MSTFDSDRAVLTAIEMSETTVAELLGKTRQAVNAGLSKNYYFKDHELIIMLLWLRANNSRFIRAFEDYINQSRKKSSNEIITCHSNFYDLNKILDKSSRIIIVLPGYSNFSQRYASLAHAVRSKLAVQPKKYLVVLSTEADASALKSDIVSTAIQSEIDYDPNELEFVHQSKANALPYMLFCDSVGRYREPYIFAGERLDAIDGIRGEEMLNFLDLPSSREVSSVLGLARQN